MRPAEETNRSLSLSKGRNATSEAPHVASTSSATVSVTVLQALRRFDKLSDRTDGTSFDGRRLDKPGTRILVAAALGPRIATRTFATPRSLSLSKGRNATSEATSVASTGSVTVLAHTRNGCIGNPTTRNSSLLLLVPERNPNTRHRTVPAPVEGAPPHPPSPREARRAHPRSSPRRATAVRWVAAESRVPGL
jgi:hypothetical protein